VIAEYHRVRLSPVDDRSLSQGLNASWHEGSIWLRCLRPYCTMTSLSCFPCFAGLISALLHAATGCNRVSRRKLRPMFRETTLTPDPELKVSFPEYPKLPVPSSPSAPKSPKSSFAARISARSMGFGPVSFRLSRMLLRDDSRLTSGIIWVYTT
jgi:hypothetical protein